MSASSRALEGSTTVAGPDGAQEVERQQADALDRQALACLAAGDGDALVGLVERHQDRLLRLCERLLGDREEARDAVQDVFLKVYGKAASYRPRGQVYTWIYRIAANHCLNRLRRRNLVRFFSLTRAPDEEPAAHAEPISEAADPATAAETRQRWRATRRAIDRLPVGQRAVLVLAKFEGLSYKQIAEALAITPGAVESRLFRAMRNLEAAQETAESRVSVGGGNQ